MSTVNWSLQHKHDTAANWTSNNPTLLAGQLGIETDGLTTTPKFKIGDGSTAWTGLPYIYGGSASAQNLNNVLGIGSSTSGKDMTITANDKIKFGVGTGAIFNDSNLIDSNHIVLASNPLYTGHTHILIQDGANEWHDESAGAFISIMAGSVPNNAIQLDAGNDKINVFSGAGGLNLQNDTYLNNLTASRLLSLDANKKIAVETGSGFLKLTSGVISYDTSTYLTTSAAALTYQPLDADLTSWSSVTRAANFDTFVATPSSANLASLVTDETGTGALVFANSPALLLPTISDTTTTTKSIAFTLSGATAAKTLTLISSHTNNRSITFPDATGTIALTSDLGSYQPLDADLTSWAGVTRASGFDTFAATPSSANLASLVTDETGSGSLVFGTAPTLSNVTLDRLYLTGNITSAAWTTNGIGIKHAARTITDTTSSGTVAAAYTNVLGGNTITASNVTTYTDYYNTYINSPVAGSNVTFTRSWSLGLAGGLDVTGTVRINGSTASTIASFDANKGLVSLATSTYPSLTELSYVKGVTSAIQTQINALPTASSTTTFTNKRMVTRVTTITSSATPTINTDNCDAVTITALAANITSFTTNLSGTPNNFDKLTIRIKDDGTARTLAWGTSFEAKGVALPTTTVISKVLTVGFIYDSVTSKWGCVSSAQEV